MVEGGIPFPMMSDSNGKIGRAYGVYSEEGGVNIRGRFLINPEGKLRAMEVLTPEVGRNVSELLRQVKAYQHIEKTGEVTPSGWEPGKKTLKPRPDLAGKVWKEWKVEDNY
ncbi:Selenocysteine-containing peroxiredoxin PrxU [Natranaerofaba carboxydovora]|nr:Selenocysteine-containing peroxiredoxin PrxU [Natranaerofaba carboxydovora]